MKKLICLLLATIGTSLIFANQQGHFFLNVEEQNVPVFNVESKLGEWLDLPENSTLIKFRDETDELGIRHLFYQQLYEGINVPSCVVQVHSVADKITCINGSIMERSLVPSNIVAQLPKRQVAQKAQAKADDSDIETTIINVDGKFYTVYKIPSIETMEVVYADVQTGDVIWRKSAFQNSDSNCRGKTLYNGWQKMTAYEYSGMYFMIDSARNIVTKAAPKSFDLTYMGKICNSLPDSIQQKILNKDVATINEYVYPPTMQDYIDNQCAYIASASTDFNITRLTKVTITDANTSWWYDIWDAKPDLYLKVFDANGNLILRTETKDDVTFPVTFVFSTPIILTSSNYSIQIYDEDATTDSYGGTVTISSIADGIYTWSNASSTSGLMEITPSGYCDIHWGMQKTLDFYKNILHRNSYDNQGALVTNIAYPSNELIFAGNVPNGAAAQMEFEPHFMFYGCGDGIEMSPVISIDIMAHEFTHLVTKFNGTGGLDYKEESGALNESFSDIMAMGAMHYTFGTCSWLIGEDFVLQQPNGRSLSNPKDSRIGGAQPDTYQCPNYWKDTSNPNDKNDHGWVHINSGVQNYWFYLLSEGGSGTNDINNQYCVTGIGIDKAIQIAYRNLIYYLTPSATYADSRNGSIQAAIDLYGKGSQEHKSVVDAWYAVGVGDKYVVPVDDYLCLANVQEQVAFLRKPSNMGNNIYCYMWIDGTATQITGAWPGQLAASLGEEYYKYSIPVSAGVSTNAWRIIWHDNKGKQTADLIYTNHGLYSGTSHSNIQCKSVVTDLCNDATEIIETSTSKTATKVLRNGQIYILHDDKTYTIQGQEVK